MRQHDSAAATGAPTSLSGRGIESRIDISAPAGVIWKLLEDVNHWGRWNPLYPWAAGSTRLGQTIEMRVALPGMKPQLARATVRVVVPTLQLQYETKSFAGLLRGIRYIDITHNGVHSTVTNGELMSGLLAPVIVRALGDRICRGLQQMNEALKKAAEAYFESTK